MSQPAFTLSIELGLIDRKVDNLIDRAKEDVYESGELLLTSAGANSILHKAPAVLGKACLEVVKGYADVIKKTDLDAIHAYIAKKSAYILQITNPDKLEPSSLFQYVGGKQVYLNDEYVASYHSLTKNFKQDIAAISQRMNNVFLRTQKKHREIWFPIIVSSALSFAAIVISIINLVWK